MTAHPWLVPVTALRRSTANRRVETRRGRVGELRVAESRVAPDAWATADAVLDSVDGGVEVTAVVRVPWEGECRRCLRPIGGTLRCEVRELYRPRAAGEAPGEDEETYPLSGEVVDLAPLVRDAILLGLPVAPVCRPDCGGLCPGCGADLNEEGCTCAPAAVDPRWAALDVLGGGSP